MKGTKMRQFNIYENPQKTTVAVKVGWSWPAFLFGVLWAFVKKLWIIGFGVTGIFFLFGIAEALTGGDVLRILSLLQTVLGFAVTLAFGIYGNRWREANLCSRGYELKLTTTAANGEGAIAAYLRTPETSKTSEIS
jgi:hypothetical protein